ncbi:MAG: alpha/beta hydrolase [Dethiosulfatibacter sp.]|nr:alpha/beta hydrolase [Dethiosulfatibacter sp.]
MRILKVLGIVLIIVLFMVILFLIASMINHRIQLKKETSAYPPPGSIVNVNDKKLHIFIAGEGDITLVFMAGHGTSSPILDFKPLWMRMTDDYRIAVVEKSGYGWSEPSNSPRDIDTILEETREALNLSGEKGPYILLPHSMSGLEAIYWAQKYPDEVTAIIGLDPTTPEAVEILPIPPGIQLNLIYLITRIGLSRLMPEADLSENLPLMKSNDLTEEDKNQYLASFFRSSLTKDMLREITNLNNNAQLVATNGIPANTPMYFFISEEQEKQVSGWDKALTEYLSKLVVSRFMRLDTGHYVHHEKADIISEAIKAFLKEIR